MLEILKSPSTLCYAFIATLLLWEGSLSMTNKRWPSCLGLALTKHMLKLFFINCAKNCLFIFFVWFCKNNPFAMSNSDHNMDSTTTWQIFASFSCQNASGCGCYNWIKLVHKRNHPYRTTLHCSKNFSSFSDTALLSCKIFTSVSYLFRKVFLFPSLQVAVSIFF